MNSRIVTVLPGIMIITLVLAGCGGGGSGSGSGGGVGTGTGLVIPEQMTVVEAVDSGGSGKPSRAKGRFAGGLVAATIPTDAAYYTDPVNVFVHDDSMESLEIVNEILCSVAQTRYSDMVNEGNYLAQIDNDQCRQGSDQSTETSEAGQSTGAEADDLEIWTVNSSRADDSSPQIVKVWIDEPAQEFEPAKRIYAKMTITEGVSDTNPYGKFSMSFKALDPDEAASSTDALFSGTLRTVDRDDGLLEYAFYMDQGDLTATPSIGEFAMRAKSRVVAGTDGSTGQAYMSSEGRYNFGEGDTSESNIFNVAYDASYFRRSPDGGTTNVCLDRTAFTDKVWRYGLYNASDGSRITMNSGFSIRTSDGRYGWVGYWGLWVPDDVTLNSGDTVTRVNPGSSESGGTYTIFTAPGKLVKHTKQTLTLGSLIGETLNYWDMNSGANYQVTWDGTDLNEDFVWNQSTMSWDSYGPVSLNSTFQPYQYVGFWSESLGGSVSLIWPEDATPTDSTPIIFYESEIINGDSALLASGNVTFHCYNSCLKSGITQDQADYNGDSPFLTDSNDINAPNTYFFVKSTMTLTTDGTSAVGLASGVTPSETSPNHWGFMGGAMVPEGTALSNSWDIWSADVFYTWETGPNQWNQFSGVKDGSGNFVSFDPPLFITYTHSDASDPGHDGHVYQLDYSGFGELHGVPFEDAGNGRWYPVITIPDGTLLGASDEYIVKALEKEQKMAEVDDSNCSALDTSNSLTAPSKDYTDPSIGSKPTVSEAPAVIKGLLASEL